MPLSHDSNEAGFNSLCRVLGPSLEENDCTMPNQQVLPLYQFTIVKGVFVKTFKMQWRISGFGQY